MNFKEIKLNNSKKKLWHHIREMLPWTLKLNCKPYITLCFTCLFFFL